jgi:hypothetical protein
MSRLVLRRGSPVLAAAVLLAACMPLGAPTPTPEQTFEGRYFWAFEASVFYPGESECTTGIPAYWLGAESGSGFFERLDALAVNVPNAKVSGVRAHVRFTGRLSPPGQYGHLGAYEREVTVVHLIDMQSAEPCPQRTSTP